MLDQLQVVPYLTPDASWAWDGNLRLRELSRVGGEFEATFGVAYDLRQDRRLAKLQRFTEDWFLRIFLGVLALALLLSVSAYHCGSFRGFVERFAGVRYLLYSTAALMAPMLLVTGVLWELVLVNAARGLYRLHNRKRSMRLRISPRELTLLEGSHAAARPWDTTRVVLLSIRPTPTGDSGPHSVVVLGSTTHESLVVFAAQPDRAQQFAETLASALGVPCESQAVKGRRQRRSGDRWTRAESHLVR
jgi:hypothetical protein